MDYNPYNRNVITKNDSFELKKEKSYEKKNWMFENSMRNSYDPKRINYNYNAFNQNGRNIIENRKDNFILNSPRNQINNNIFQSNFRNNNLNINPNKIRYLIYIPVQIPQNQNTNIYNSPQLFQYNKSNFQPNKFIQKDNNDYFSFGSDAKKREEERQIKMQTYREELLKQIAEKKRADEEKKRKMKEEEKKEIIKNEEYFKLKKLQADEQARKLKEKIARRMQEQQAEEFGNASNILEISKDFENMNKSRQGTSLVNNIEFNKRKNSIKNANLNNYINYYGNENISSFANNNMILEQENYMKEIDNEYNELCQTINFDIDQMINTNKNEELNLDLPEYDAQFKRKEKQFADYMLSKTLTPPTPFKFEKNPLLYSYQPRPKDKNKMLNLEEFFDKDKEKDYYLDDRPIQKKSYIRNKTNKEYFDIFESLNDAKTYTKKYSKDKDQYSHSETLISNNSYSNKDENADNNETKNKFDLASYYNLTISNSMYEKENNKNENDEDNAIKIEDSSMRTTGNKNKSKSLLDKKLLNIKENKEDEEDEEDDEENKKLKEEKQDKIENKKEDNLENQENNKEEVKNVNEEKEDENEEEEEDDQNDKDNNNNK